MSSVGPVSVRGDHPGGNITQVVVQGDTIRLAQDLRDTEGWWFYWNCRVEGAAGRELLFRFTNGEVVGPYGPAVSRDGRDWSWAGRATRVSGSSFRYRFAADADVVYFSMCVPYVGRDWAAWCARHRDHPQLVQTALTTSEHGRAVPLLRLGRPDAPRQILFTARHHACEASASYLLEGILDYCLDPQSTLLAGTCVHVVPFVDVDGVEQGDQGKNRRPHDHCGDYGEAPIYRAVQALQGYLRPLPLTAGIDLHSPWLWGGRNDRPFISHKGRPTNEVEARRFGGFLAEETRRSPAGDRLRYDPADDVAVGVEWNQPAHPTSGRYFCSLGARLGFSFEMPYFGEGRPVLTPAVVRRFGRDFGVAMERYLAA